MGYVDVSGVRHTLPDRRVLLDDVNFRVGDGVRAALVGENGAGKTTLLRIIAGDLIPEAGSVARTGGLGVMRQFIGSVRDDTTVQRLLVDLSPPAVREAWDAVEAAELALMETDDERGQMAYAHALVALGRRGRLRRRGHLGHRDRRGPRRPLRPVQVPRAVDTVGRGAEAAGTGGAAARTRRGAAARRAGQLPRRPGQAVAGGAAARDAEDRAVRQSRPGAARRGSPTGW